MQLFAILSSRVKDVSMVCKFRAMQGHIYFHVKGIFYGIHEILYPAQAVLIAFLNLWIIHRSLGTYLHIPN